MPYVKNFNEASFWQFCLLSALLAVLKNMVAGLPVATYRAGKRDMGSGGEEMGSTAKTTGPRLHKADELKNFSAAFCSVLGAERFIFVVNQLESEPLGNCSYAKVMIFEFGSRIWANVMPRIQLGRAYEWLQVLWPFLRDLAPQDSSAWLMRAHNSGLYVSF